MARRVDLGSVVGPPGPEGKGASNGTQLTNQNLNNYRTEDLCGWYFAGGSNKVTNKPSGVDAFGMWVLRVASGYYQQELHTANTAANKVFIRTYGGTGGWSSWVEKGKDGATGPKGDTGATGATGPKGADGKDGADGTKIYAQASAPTGVASGTVWIDT